MINNVNYFISAVRYSNTDTTEFISCAKVHLNLNESVGNSSTVWTRKEIVTAIYSGVVFHTIKKQGNNKWNKVALVETFNINNTQYIKTQRDKTKKDYLGQLPKF